METFNDFTKNVAVLTSDITWDDLLLLGDVPVKHWDIFLRLLIVGVQYKSCIQIIENVLPVAEEFGITHNELIEEFRDQMKYYFLTSKEFNSEARKAMKEIIKNKNNTNESKT
jgi:hypothetical protein